MRGNTQAWVARLHWLGDHPRERVDLVAGCVVLGHDPSGEQLMTAIPIDICWWCGYTFRQPPRVARGHEDPPLWIQGAH